MRQARRMQLQMPRFLSLPNGVAAADLDTWALNVHQLSEPELALGQLQFVLQRYSFAVSARVVFR